MVDPDVEEILIHNQDALEELTWAIESSQGQFSLTLARCNYVSLRDQLVTHIQKTCAVNLLVTPLRQTSQTLYTRLRALADATSVKALMVLGLETVNDLEEMLPAVNSVREEFRKNFPFPIVLWVTDAVHSKLVQLAPDFESWATTTDFTLPPSTLLEALREASDRLFSTLLTPDSNRSFRRLLENLDFGFLKRAEIEAAVRDLQKTGQPLAPDLQATLDFLRGLNAPTNQEALAYFQCSLEYWQPLAASPPTPDPRHPTPALISGLLLYFIGRTLYNICSENKYRQENWEPPKQPLQDCLMVFEQENRSDLVAKSITQLERVFDQLKAWEELAALAQKSLLLQQTYNDRARQAQDYRYLALTAIQRGQAAEAKRYAEQALELTEQVSEDQRYRGLYLLTLAEATKLTGQRDAALACLHKARSLGDQGIPRVYIAILEALRNYYIEQKDYLAAFRLKQERLSVEQQYQLRAFVGAGRLRAQRQDQEALRLNAVGTTNRSPLTVETLPVGIASWQRQRDVKQLIERIGRNDCKLSVIHGYSGVGKSSLISAGLVPTLEQKAIGLQPNLPVVVRKYTDWAEELGRRMAEVLEERGQGKEGEAGGVKEAGEVQGDAGTRRHSDTATVIEPHTLHPTPHTLINQLRHNEQRNLRTILIFDQFEEFFFVYPTPALRRPFFAFLGQCLQLLSVKVVLPLREDYLYYLLEFNRIPEISATGIDVLSRNVLYPLGNFTPDDARAIIQELTEQARFYLEPSLVEALVMDLTDENGEVRPIELQIVGAQLQTDDIRSLEAYRKLQDAGKPAKEVLVGRYLAEVVADCGTDNQRAAELVLYLLTDENNTRPLKTRAELVEDMGEETTKLDFVLEILVRSGLVMLLPEVPADRYQLVHDYLVPYIRQQKQVELIAELRKERELRSLTEEQLRQTLKQLEQSLEQEKQAREQAEVSEIEALSLSSQALLLSHDQLGALVAGVKAGKQLQSTNASIPIQVETLAKLRQALHSIHEINRLQAHGDWIHDVAVSPDGQWLVSCSRDSSIKLWSMDGKELKTIAAHADWVNSVCFSPNGQMVASGGGDDVIKLWSLEGQRLKTFSGHRRGVRSVSFSPDGQMVASASADTTIKLWNLNGDVLQTLTSHRAEVNDVCFHPNGEMLISASNDRTLKLWDLQGQELQTFTGHISEVLSVCLSPNGQVAASGGGDNTVKLWSLDGQELNTLLAHSDRVVSVSFSPDGQMVASGSGDGTIILWDLDGRILQTFSGHREWVNSIKFSPDGQFLVSGSGDRTVRFWSLMSRESRISLGEASRVTSISFSPDGKTLGISREDNNIQFWSVDDPKLQKDFPKKYLGIEIICFSPDGQLLVAGDRFGIIHLWNLHGEKLKTISGHHRRIRNVCFHPNGQVFASRDLHDIKLWSLAGHELKKISFGASAGRNLCFSPDGQMLAVDSGDGLIKLLSLDGQTIQTFQDASHRIGSICFSPDGSRLAIGSGDRGTISLLSLDGQEVMTFSGHSVGVSSLCFSPNGQMLASGSGDRTVKIWNLRGEVLQACSEHMAGVTRVSFSPNGQILASGSCDGTVILRNLNLLYLDLNQLLTQGCLWLQNYLRNNSTVNESDRHLCDGIPKQS